MADDIIKQLENFREQMVAKFDKFFEIAADIQQQLQVHERSKGKEIGDDFSFANAQVDNLPYLPLSMPQNIEMESEILPSNQHMSPMSNDSSDSQLESEGFGEVLNHSPITATDVKSRFDESKSEVLANFQREESISEFEVLPKLPLVVFLRFADMEVSRNIDVRKVFDQLTKRDFSALKVVVVCVDLGEEINVYRKKNKVINEPDAATRRVGFEMKSYDNIMSFDPGGGYVFDESSPQKIYAFQYFDSHGMSFIAKLFFPEQRMNATSVAHTCNDAIFSFQFVSIGKMKFHSPHQSQPMETTSFLSMHQATKFLYNETIHHWILEEWAEESDASQQNGRRPKHQNLCADMDRFNGVAIESSFSLSLFNGLVKGGEILRSLCAGVHWISFVLALAQKEFVDFFFSQNSFRSYKTHQKSGIPQPIQFLQTSYPQGKPLATVFVHGTLIEMLNTTWMLLVLLHIRFWCLWRIYWSELMLKPLDA